MGDKTKIEWTDTTWNPLRGCSRVSEGCRNCYAEAMASRFSGVGQPYEGLIIQDSGVWSGDIKQVPEKLDAPLRWTKPRRVFVNSMSDLFHKNADRYYIGAVFAVMAMSPKHTFQVLTKRPQVMRDWFAFMESIGELGASWRPGVDEHTPASRAAKRKALLEALRGYAAQELNVYAEHLPPIPPMWPPANVQLGVSVEDQVTADERIPLLLQTPAWTRFVSAEPLLGPIEFSAAPMHVPHGDETPYWLPNPKEYDDFRYWQVKMRTLDWVIVGGESGPRARPMHPAWVREIRDQCKAADVPFFFKQWGRWGLKPTSGAGLSKVATAKKRVLEHCGERAEMFELGKRNTGRHFEGKLYTAMPGVSKLNACKDSEEPDR